MKQTNFITTGMMLVLAGLAYGQSAPPAPKPVVESDLRDNTIKMRSIELERVKRDAARIRPKEDTAERARKFTETKENFEDIQKLQDSIIEAYTRGEEIGYSKISRSAAAIKKKSQWLDENLFGAIPEDIGGVEDSESYGQTSVRDLIIELDNAIGNFIKSPIFVDTKVVDLKVSAETEAELRTIIRISDLLAIAAQKMK